MVKLVDASKTGVTQETLQNAVRRGSKAMTELEARQILGVTEKSSWEEISQKYDKLFEQNATNGSFYLQSKRHTLHCNFFNETRLPSPAYAWVKCEREEESDCGAVLEAGKISERPVLSWSTKAVADAETVAQQCHAPGMAELFLTVQFTKVNLFVSAIVVMVFLIALSSILVAL
ncbi:protein Transporter, Pam16 [Artemisia annua]|uniref:Protein Transporter, Pam16 n=1 Tax=Artemisia annua TaxID=35608 RepID=A0A2U1KMU5_ARTAN|nr:protein Transporter, Pam16 [Artemisia annua]